MRQIGSVTNEVDARNFSNFLVVNGIDNDIEADNQAWSIWVHDEEKLDQAARYLQEFQKDTGNATYSTHNRDAARLKAQQAKEAEAYQKKVKDGRLAASSMSSMGIGPATGILIAISIGVFIYSGMYSGTEDSIQLAKHLESIRALLFSEYGSDAHGFARLKDMGQVFHGEVWRLVTPIFIHFGFMHIFFNMMWLRDLGTAIEQRLGTRALIVQVLVIGAASNVGQFLTGSIIFGGMSGVIYGLFGYIWIRGKFDPRLGILMHSTTVTMMIIWFFLCLFGVIPHVANAAHGVGLAAGMAWGYIDARRP